MLLPETPSQHARDHLLAEHRLGCELVAATAADVRDTEGVLARANREAPSYLIPMGGTSPLGNTGYVNAAFELAAQCDAGELPIPDVIYVALGTAGTAAGLYVGLRAAGLATRLVAVRASNPGRGSLRNLRAAIEATSSYLHQLDASFPEVEAEESLLHLEHGSAGRGYAIPTEEGARAAALAQELEGIRLDSTYTAKAFAALINDAPRLSGESVLFWNTYDPRTVSTEGVTPEDLPRAFQRYFR
jgi:D-cysteine desulfhydrase